MVDQCLYSPSEARIKESSMFNFLQQMKAKGYVKSDDYLDLHSFSVKEKEVFWKELITFYDISITGSLDPVLLDDSFKSYTWFSETRLNFAQNLLKNGEDSAVALNFVHESGLTNKITYSDLKKTTGRLQNALRPLISKGDVLACFMPNLPETTISMLAASSLGVTFTSTSSDFGVEGVTDRFGQSRPKVLVAACGYDYNGKYFDCLPKIKTIKEKLPFIEKIVLVDFLNKRPEISDIDNALFWDDFLSDDYRLEFVPVAFSHPLYIMYSSGTTGSPKCIVHSTGGTLLQHIKELGLHSDLSAKKNIMFFTTCGWMMWNWLVSSLYFGATVTLFEGSPGFPSLSHFLSIINREKINIFGTSPKFLKALEDSHEKIESFPTLETILSTGAPLLPEQFDFVYKKIKSDIQLSSISGGTDILGCFMLGNPMLPVYRGEIQCIGLGMDVACFSSDGKDLKGKEGELVCKHTFPSRPIYFLDDKDNEKINKAYFFEFPGVWHHGDFVSVTQRGSVVVYGRSDATLNPGGVRIGTAEIYRQTEGLSYLVDSICIGKQEDGDVSILLFVKMKSGELLNSDRISEIKSLIKKNTTPRHVPKDIFTVTDIPYTRSGKKMELAVTRIVNRKELTNIEAVANPECLDEYKKYQ